MKTYTIGDKTYTMDELVLDQEEALAELLQPLYEAGETTAKGLVDGLLRQKLLKRALAIILMPAGQEIEKVDREEVFAHLGRHLKLSAQAQVIRDFFEVNGEAIAALKGLAVAPVAKEGSPS